MIKYNIFRDNGIVISISVVQCSVECILMITCSFYIYFLNGYSKTFDKFFNIYLSIVTVIILPTFYLNGEAAFRRNLAAYGPFRALKNAIVGKLWMAEEIVFCWVHLNVITKKTTKFRLVMKKSDNFPRSKCDFFLKLHKYMDVIRKIDTFLVLSISQNNIWSFKCILQKTKTGKFCLDFEKNANLFK